LWSNRNGFAKRLLFCQTSKEVFTWSLMASIQRGIANPPKATTTLFKGERKVKVAPSLMQTIMWPSILPTPTKQQETQAST
jgi:hypothetical protein